MLKNTLRVALTLLLAAASGVVLAGQDADDSPEPTTAEPDVTDAPDVRPTAIDEIVVTARFSLLREDPVPTVGLDRDEIMAMPHFADDLYRAVTVLPGTSSNDFSGRFSVRGGLHDEVLVRLDGVELFEPFHLKDFQGTFNILDPAVIAGVDLMTGGFPVEYGDRMSGVLEMTSLRPAGGRGSLGISFSNAWAGGAGTFADGKGSWLASGRRGYLDILLRIAEDDEDGDDEDPSPRYWDAFGKLTYDLGASQSLSFNVLTADDSLDFEETDFDELTEVATSYGSSYAWLGHQALLSDRTVVDTVGSFSRVDGDRLALSLEPDESFEVSDFRDVDVLGLRQSWSHQLSERQFLKWGFEARRYEARYAYLNTLELEHPIDDPRFQPGSGATSFAGRPTGEQLTLYAADRLRLGSRLTAELGLRYDEQTLADDSQVSPRANLVADLGRRGVLRLGWGHFFQSQRPHELGVQFGETDFQPASRAEHWTLGYETRLAEAYTLRLDAYRREVSDPQRRYETLFDPFHPFPEAAIDLVRVAPEGVSADGVELYLARRKGGKVNWWVSYALSSIDDQVDGRDQPRSIDQTHAVTASLAWRPSRKWSLNWVWTYHSGWPTTDVAAQVVYGPDGSHHFTYDVGPFYAENLDDYQRLDFRASRTSQLRKGALTFFIDVLNLTNRDNPRGLGIDDPIYNSQTGNVRFPTETWLGMIPSFGVSWEF